MLARTTGTRPLSLSQRALRAYKGLGTRLGGRVACDASVSVGGCSKVCSGYVVRCSKDRGVVRLIVVMCSKIVVTL